MFRSIRYSSTTGSIWYWSDRNSENNKFDWRLLIEWATTVLMMGYIYTIHTCIAQSSTIWMQSLWNSFVWSEHWSSNNREVSHIIKSTQSREQHPDRSTPLTTQNLLDLSLATWLEEPPSEIYQIFRFIENRKTSYVHGRASLGDLPSRKQLENGQSVQILPLGPPIIIVVRHFI